MARISEWLAGIKADKMLHFVAGLAVAQVAFGLLRLAVPPIVALPLAAAVAAIAGAAKELWDAAGHGVASWRDFIATLAGGIVGLTLIVPCC